MVVTSILLTETELCRMVRESFVFCLLVWRTEVMWPCTWERQLFFYGKSRCVCFVNRRWLPSSIKPFWCLLLCNCWHTILLPKSVKYSTGQDLCLVVDGFSFKFWASIVCCCSRWDILYYCNFTEWLLADYNCTWPHMCSWTRLCTEKNNPVNCYHLGFNDLMTRVLPL